MKEVINMSLPVKKKPEDILAMAELSTQKFYELVKNEIEDGFELEEMRTILKDISLDEMILQERRKERERCKS